MFSGVDGGVMVLLVLQDVGGWCLKLIVMYRIYSDSENGANDAWCCKMKVDCVSGLL